MAFSGKEARGLPCARWLTTTKGIISAHLKHLTVPGNPQNPGPTHSGRETLGASTPVLSPWDTPRKHSLFVINKVGNQLVNYRKSFLYYTDDSWAREGPGFYEGKLGSWKGVAMGICGPYNFDAPWDAYKIASHVLKVRGKPGHSVHSMAGQRRPPAVE
ncbi:hypothetical protein C7999DRAFT_30614 [Corynascus novoguineensis]|uniref:Uncharacterized protein n=1 Tax=Corynascus novoguineensis TaxID=1126955 RepID=A0AAN7CV34_9PEZI|nr:hypothetical protein C7999DRAFT_30614 [Corynascus novoguineensis]